VTFHFLDEFKCFDAHSQARVIRLAALYRANERRYQVCQPTTAITELPPVSDKAKRLPFFRDMKFRPARIKANVKAH